MIRAKLAFNGLQWTCSRCKLQVCNCVVEKNAGGRLAFVLEKRLDFHPSDCPEPSWREGQPPQGYSAAGVGCVSSKVAVAYRIRCHCGCELLSHWQVFTDSNDHIDAKVMVCIPLPEAISPDC